MALFSAAKVNGFFPFLGALVLQRSLLKWMGYKEMK